MATEELAAKLVVARRRSKDVSNVDQVEVAQDSSACQVDGEQGSVAKRGADNRRADFQRTSRAMQSFLMGNVSSDEEIIVPEEEEEATYPEAGCENRRMESPSPQNACAEHSSCGLHDGGACHENASTGWRLDASDCSSSEGDEDGVDLDEDLVGARMSTTETLRGLVADLDDLNRRCLGQESQEESDVQMAPMSVTREETDAGMQEVVAHGSIRSVAEEISVMLDMTAESTAIRSSGCEDRSLPKDCVEPGANTSKAAKRRPPSLQPSEKELFRDIMRLRPSVSAVAHQIPTSAAKTKVKSATKQIAQKDLIKEDPRRNTCTETRSRASGSNIHLALLRMEKEAAMGVAKRKQRERSHLHFDFEDEHDDEGEALRRESEQLRTKCQDLWVESRQLQQQLAGGGSPHVSPRKTAQQARGPLGATTALAAFSRGPELTPRGMVLRGVREGQLVEDCNAPNAVASRRCPIPSKSVAGSGRFSFPTQLAGSFANFEKAKEFDNQSQCSTAIPASLVGSGW